jgi:DNA mismatch repair protein MutS2
MWIQGIEALDRYLDQAIVHHVKQVRIIHGMGTGRLRAAVWDDLDKNPVVKSKMAAGPNEGGLGATIVLLK